MKPQPKKAPTATPFSDPIFHGMSKKEGALLAAHDQIGATLKTPHLPKRAKVILAHAHSVLLDMLIEVSE